VAEITWLSGTTPSTASCCSIRCPGDRRAGGLCSRRSPPARTLTGWHWHIENQLHWVRDVTYDEDRSQIRTNHCPQVMASLRNLAISALRLAGHTNIAHANRHHANRPERPITLLLTS